MSRIDLVASSLMRAVVAIAFFPGWPGMCDGAQSARGHDRCVGKNTTQSEWRISKVLKKPLAVREDLGHLPKVTLIPVKYDSAELVQFLKCLYWGRSRFKVEALPKLKSVAVQADEHTTKEIVKLLEEIDKIAFDSSQGKARVGPIRTDPRVEEEVIRQLKRK